MDFNRYQRLAARTMPMPGVNDPRLQACIWALGLAGEAAELHHEVRVPSRPGAVKRELGDLFWYLAALSTHYDMDLSDVLKTDSPDDFSLALKKSRELKLDDHSHQVNLEEMIEAAGIIADMVKKVEGHGHKMNKRELSRELHTVARHAAWIAYRYFPLSEALQGNIAKLKKRYPRGFSPARSVSRRKGDT